GWTHTATLDGQGGNDTVSSTNDADFSLTDGSLVRSNGGSGTFTLTSVEIASLTGGAGANTFNIGAPSAWTGAANLDGAGGGDSYNVAFNATGQTVTIADSGASGSDTAAVTGRAGNSTITVDATKTTEGSNTVNYGATLEDLTVNGGPALDTG